MIVGLTIAAQKQKKPYVTLLLKYSWILPLCLHSLSIVDQTLWKHFPICQQRSTLSAAHDVCLCSRKTLYQEEEEEDSDTNTDPKDTNRLTLSWGTRLPVRAATSPPNVSPDQNFKAQDRKHMLCFSKTTISYVFHLCCFCSICCILQMDDSDKR